MNAPPGSRSLRAGFAFLPVVAGLAAARPAAADDAKPVEVTVTPQGRPWAIGRYGGQECAPTCRLHVAPDKYLVTIGGAREELLIDTPTAFTYSPGAPRLQTVAGWTAVGGVGIGGVFLGFAIYGYAKSCANSQGCPGFTLSRTTKEVVVITAAALISISVAGGIVYAITGESIRGRDLPPSAPAARRTWDVTLSPSTAGGSVDFVKRF